MSFWTWAKGLEDAFDSANRKNLRHFIRAADEDDPNSALYAIPEDGRADTVTEDVTEDIASFSGGEKKSNYYFVDEDNLGIKLDADHEKVTLARVNTCAIFHKLTHGKGVPHTFMGESYLWCFLEYLQLIYSSSGFIRQWPALPRVVIFLSVCTLPTPRVDPQDRYVVNKARTVEGFFGVTYYLGFRDNFDVQISEITERICGIEARDDPRESAVIIGEIRKATRSVTHMYVHCSVQLWHIPTTSL